MRAFAGSTRIIAYGALATAIGSPFLFGAAERTVWLPLCGFWVAAGLAQAWLTESRDYLRPFLAVHALFAIQLVPLPGALLRWISPGSYAAHFLPDRGALLRPLSVSPGATVESWLYFTAMLGLFIALRPLTEHRRSALTVVGAVLLVLATEGLWQSRSSHPYWLLGLVPPTVPVGLETSIFGPYFNRNHFATMMALGAAVSCGAAVACYSAVRDIRRLLASSRDFARVILFLGAAGVFALACAATGSRSGLLAMAAGVSFVGLRRIPWRWLLPALGAGGLLVFLAGPFVVDRLLKMDFLASRLSPWADMATLIRFFPIFGSGLGTFSVAYWPYQRNVSYEFWLHAHNEYLQWVIETGIVGTIILFIAVKAVQSRIVFDPVVGDLGAAALVVFGVQSLLDFPVRLPANAAILTTVLALTTARAAPGDPSR